jgi:hypothetical protein
MCVRRSPLATAGAGKKKKSRRRKQGDDNFDADRPVRPPTPENHPVCASRAKPHMAHKKTGKALFRLRFRVAEFDPQFHSPIRILQVYRETKMESARAKKEGFPWDLRAVWQVCALALTSLCVGVRVCLGAVCAANARTDLCVCVCVCVCVSVPVPVSVCPFSYVRFCVSVSVFVVVAILDLHKRYQRRHAGRAQVDLRDHHTYATNRREQQTHQVVNMHTGCIHAAFTR